MFLSLCLGSTRRFGVLAEYAVLVEYATVLNMRFTPNMRRFSQRTHPLTMSNPANCVL